MARYHRPNPLDLMFFAADRAGRRLGLSNVNIQIALELSGRIDLARLRRAVAALHHRYPVTAATAEYSFASGLPRWRIDRDTLDVRLVTPVHEVDGPGDASIHRTIEQIYATPIDVRRRPGAMLHVLRGQDGRDVLLTRFAHKLMDARGATFFLEDLDSLYESDADPASEPDAGDWRRDDYARLLNSVSGMSRIRAAIRLVVKSCGITPPTARLTRTPLRRGSIGRLRCDIRPLTPDQSRKVQDNAMRICGFGRLGDYLRACAIRAFHRAIRVVERGAVCTTLNLINNRKRRERTPVCRNLTSAIPLSVPMSIAEDIARVADMLRDQTLEQKASDRANHQLATLALFMRAPTALTSAFIYSSWTSQRQKTSPGLFEPPSLPFGITGPFSRPMPMFCGVPLENYYGLATARPLPGFTIDANITADRINLCGGHYDGLISVETMHSLLDETIDAALNPGV